MRTTLFGSVVLTAIVAASACNDNPVSCTAQSVPAVAVTVRDSLTNALAGRGARIVARDGAFADTARATTTYDGPYDLAPERSGTYTVTVEQQGYRVWSQQGVSVGRDKCHLRTATLTARLQR